MPTAAHFTSRPLRSAAHLCLVLVVALFCSPAVTQVRAAEETPPQGRYQQLQNALLSQVDGENPRVALATLRGLLNDDPLARRFCHSLTHAIGHRAYEKYGDFGQAVAYRDEVCNSGYLHGVIEWAFKDAPDVRAAMRSICEPYPFGKYLSWECYHGVGHGAMFSTANDLPEVVKLCEAYARRFARDSCLNGVYMENFNTNQQLHPSRYRDPNDLFFPCNLPDNAHKVECYLYAPTYFLSLQADDYAAALQWCTTAEPGFAQVCASGVGGEAIKQNVNDPKMAEAICLAAPVGLQGSCLAGMVDLYILHHGALEPARALCAQLEAVSRPICEQVVAAEAELF